jgi:hypothetical protein
MWLIGIYNYKAQFIFENPLVSYYPRKCVERMRKTTKSLSQDNRASNPGVSG